SKIDPSLVTQAERDSLPPVRQAMVLDHGPELGKSLYLGAHAKAIEGMDAAASTALIEELMAFATQERFIYRHQWRPHDLLIWHNRTVLHRATPFDGAREKRLMVRTTVAGEAPTLSAAA
ncbi:MAG: TauD/TfdA family dioxygenase, partial [Pseudomonadota bacterium]|nr:TauD/TfdA family dioxygenase [Pseudomonadota bacterium]